VANCYGEDDAGGSDVGRNTLTAYNIQQNISLHPVGSREGVIKELGNRVVRETMRVVDIVFREVCE
jgi:hypothetical protein